MLSTQTQIFSAAICCTVGQKLEFRSKISDNQILINSIQKLRREAPVNPVTGMCHSFHLSVSDYSKQLSSKQIQIVTEKEE